MDKHNNTSPTKETDIEQKEEMLKPGYLIYMQEELDLGNRALKTCRYILAGIEGEISDDDAWGFQIIIETLVEKQEAIVEKYVALYLNSDEWLLHHAEICMDRRGSTSRKADIERFKDSLADVNIIISRNSEGKDKALAIKAEVEKLLAAYGEKVQP